MSEIKVPAPLLAAVKGDLRPVRPLASPLLRALTLLPVGVLLLVGIPAYWAGRTVTGTTPASWWLLSSVETVVGLLVLWAAFREAVPGRELSRRLLVLLALLAGGAFVLINLTTDPPLAPEVSLATTARWIGECLGVAMTFAVPALLLPAWLVARALPNRPGVAGALCGVAIGLMADAGLRLFCWDGERSHILIAHGGAIAILVGLGALAALGVERSKRR
ncbi:MAG TPA: NrsF family protein [Steroidobacteraceae bacterium]|nr:NrsF family protein [Steroidobacteraceae bacterium]